MGAILSFSRNIGHWTASERARLEAMMEQVFGGDQDLHITFGAADDGAPWCAVTNADGEVLVHVARLADNFIAHFGAEDVVTEGATLREAFGKRLEPERMGVVVPFPRPQDGFDMLALMAMAVFLEDHLKLAASLPYGEEVPSITPPWNEPSIAEDTAAAEEPSDSAGKAQPAPAPATDDDASRGQGLVAHNSNDTNEAEPTKPQVATITPETATSDSPRASDLPSASANAATIQAPLFLAAVIKGGDGDDLLIGSARAERLLGGNGEDTLVGGGGRDTLDGGAGDDWIFLTSEATATGGAGADTFVIVAPTILGDAGTLLGTITDFQESEGDRLMTGKGDVVIVPLRTDAGATFTAEGDQRVEVDVDGDGTVDGYVLLTTASITQGAEPGGATTSAWGWSDFVG